ncbi:MAG: ABC transporter substrate-binding protein [Anaerolineae bacterium]|nr:ABC transporter substrate-binding protein [Anaerolineae bacterium]
MKQVAKCFVIVALLVASLSVAAGQGSEDTIVLAVSYDVITFNPILSADGGSFNAIGYIFPTLYQVDAQTGQILPDLATWEISEDGLTYTFYIREDAVWSDGMPIIAQDVKFTYDAIASDLVESPRKSDVIRIQEINVIDDKTVEVVLTEVDCTFLGNLGINILPSHKFAPDFSDVMDNPMNTAPDIGGGPYLLDEWLPDEYVRLVANPTFYDGEPNIPYLVLRIVTEPAVINQMLLAGEVDYAFMYPDEYKQLGSYDNFNAGSFPLHNTPLFAMNWANPENPQAAYDADGNLIEQDPHPILSDVLVRQAIAMGYSKDDILATLDGEGVRLTASVIEPVIPWAYNYDLEPWPYDPERAAALLEEAGWVDTDGDGIRDKDGMPLKLTIMQSPGVTDLWDNIALVAQDQLSQLGMDITLESLEWGAFIERLLAQQFDMLVVGFGGGLPPDPDGIAGNIARSANDIPNAGFNMTSYVNLEVDQLLDSGKTVPGCAYEERAPFYVEAQRIMFEEVAYDFTVSPNQVNVMNKRIKGYEFGGLWTQHTDPEKWYIEQ